MENYGLDKKLSMWNVAKVQNPEQHGGFKTMAFKILSVVSLGWIIGLILFITTRSSKSEVRKAQGSIFLFTAIIGFVIWIGYLLTHGA